LKTWNSLQCIACYQSYPARLITNKSNFINKK
jgi:hypothetical protein